MFVQIKPQLKLNTIFYFCGYNMPNSLCKVSFLCFNYFVKIQVRDQYTFWSESAWTIFVYYVECTDI